MEFLREYNKLVKTREEITRQIKDLKEQNKLIVDKITTSLYTKTKNLEYSNCNHIWIIEPDHLTRKCVKCGLGTIVLYSQDLFKLEFSELGLEKKAMYKFMISNPDFESKGMKSRIVFNPYIAKAVYLKIKEKHPTADDKTLFKYLETALINMANIKINEERKISRAKRLSLNPSYAKYF